MCADVSIYIHIHIHGTDEENSGSLISCPRGSRRGYIISPIRRKRKEGGPRASLFADLPLLLLSRRDAALRSISRNNFDSRLELNFNDTALCAANRCDFLMTPLLLISDSRMIGQFRRIVKRSRKRERIRAKLKERRDFRRGNRLGLYRRQSQLQDARR